MQRTTIKFVSLKAFVIHIVTIHPLNNTQQINYAYATNSSYVLSFATVFQHFDVWRKFERIHNTRAISGSTVVIYISHRLLESTMEHCRTRYSQRRSLFAGPPVLFLHCFFGDCFYLVGSATRVYLVGYVLS